MANIESAEAYVVDRYKLWQRWQTNYDYKHRKGARIGEIVRETGGFVPLALEIGVGPGGVATALSRRGMKIIGLDLSPDALIRAREHCHGENVRLMRASGFSLPFGDRSLMLVYASQVLHLFDAQGRSALISEVSRVLRPGGRFVFDMKNVSSHPLRYWRSSEERRKRNFPPRAEIESLVKTAGFSSVTRRPGLLPLLGWSRVPNSLFSRSLAHTTFFVATR